MNSQSPGEGNLTYPQFVDYKKMDPFKLACLVEAIKTLGNLSRYPGFEPIEWTWGESVHLIRTPWFILGHTDESLGTKNRAADALRLLALAKKIERLAGKTFYANVAQCALAMIFNDMATLGVDPIQVMMHLAAGSDDWFKDEARYNDLITGWKATCDLAGCVWGGGETPTLKGMIDPETVVLAGSGVGIILPSERLIEANIQDGDSIVVFKSSGIHANGLSLARAVADRLPEGYLTTMDDKRTYGEALLTPTYIYSHVVRACLDQFKPHYAVNITGHGWAKMMRAQAPFTYVVERTFDPQPEFTLIQEHSGQTDREMWSTFNMGGGFALISSPEDAVQTVRIAAEHNMTAMLAGHVEASQQKRVVIEPHGIEFDELGIR